ncbi:MAG: transposase, partial [Candidatus Hodarchaeales archaeon]
MLTRQEIHYPSRTVKVFKSTHLDRILRKHIHEIEADRNRKEFSCEQWIKSLFLMQIQRFEAVRPFVRQLEQNKAWQGICGFRGNVPTQGQYSRRIPDQRIQEVLVRTFSTYQRLIPMKQNKLPNTPSKAQLTLLQHGYYPFRIDCTSLKLSSDRYPYASWGYVASEKKTFPSARIHTIQEGIHGFITNYGPSGGHEHESPIAEVLLNETEEPTSWLVANSTVDRPRPFVMFDRGYWKIDRFRGLDSRQWGWSIPWKRKTLIGVQMEILDFPRDDNTPIEVLVWGSNTDKPWRRIIGRPDLSHDGIWDVFTNDLLLPPSVVLQLQK